MADPRTVSALVTRQSVFASGLSDFPVTHSGLVVREAEPIGILRVQWREGDGTFVRNLEAHCSHSLPGHGRVGESKSAHLARSGPSECLLFCAIEEDLRTCRALADLKGDQATAVTVISDSRAGFTIRGSAARDFLAKGCSLDLDGPAFQAGEVASTRFAGQGAMVWCRSADSFLLFCDVGLAAFMRRWIVDAAEEFGSGHQSSLAKTR